MKQEFNKLVNAMADYGLISKENLVKLLEFPDQEVWEIDEWDWLMETYYKELDETLINSILEATNEAFMADAEAGQIPPPYENSMIPSLLDFVNLDKQHAEIKLTYERKESEKDEYSLNIKYLGKLYQKTLQDFGDYYDVDGMLSILNDIIIDQNKAFILRELPTNDQAFCYYIGDFVKLNEFLVKYKSSK